MHPENILCSLGMGRWKFAARTLLKAWYKHIYSPCTIIQCPTENVKERLVRYHFKPELRVISNGLIPAECIRPRTMPENYMDPERPFEVACIGRLAPEKDQPTLLEAMRYCKEANRIHLTFAGSGPKLKEYKKMARKLMDEGILKYEPSFVFLDKEGLQKLAASADLCIHCAVLEVEGLSIMEAMQQAAVPVIASGRYCGTTQFALDRRSLFPCRNSEVLAQRIDYWLSHPQERWEMGFKYAESMKQYDIAHSVEQMIRLFKDALS